MTKTTLQKWNALLQGSNQCGIVGRSSWNPIPRSKKSHAWRCQRPYLCKAGNIASLLSTTNPPVQFKVAVRCLSKNKKNIFRLLAERSIFCLYVRLPMAETVNHARHPGDAFIVLALMHHFSDRSCAAIVAPGGSINSSVSLAYLNSLHRSSFRGGKLHVADSANCLFDRIASFTDGEPQQGAVRVHPRVVGEVENHAWNNAHLCVQSNTRAPEN